MPNTLNPSAWHAYISAARTLVESTRRMEQAVNAGVDFAALLACSEA